jgi:hypothetical protein
MSVGQIPGWQWGMVTGPVYPVGALFTGRTKTAEVDRDAEPNRGAVREYQGGGSQAGRLWNLKCLNELQTGSESC